MQNTLYPQKYSFTSGFLCPFGHIKIRIQTTSHLLVPLHTNLFPHTGTYFRYATPLKPSEQTSLRKDIGTQKSSFLQEKETHNPPGGEPTLFPVS